MASAQVLPNSRKQEHLAAGKRRLEEFRKKKATDRAKKSSSSNISDITLNENKPSDAQFTLGNSDGPIRQPSISKTNNGLFDISQKSEQDSEFFMDNTTHAFSGYPAQIHVSDGDHNKGLKVLKSNRTVDYSISQEPKHTDGDSGTFQELSYSFTSDHDTKVNDETPGKENNSYLEEISLMNPESSNVAGNNFNSQIFPSFTPPLKSTSASSFPWGNQEAIQPSSIGGFATESGQMTYDAAISDGHEKADVHERKFSSSSSELPALQSLAPYAIPQYSSTTYSSGYSNSSDRTPLYTPISESQGLPRRSRPSFLDSLNVPRASPAFSSKSADSRESISGNDNGNHMDSLGQSTFGTQYMDNLTTSVTSVNNGKHLPDGGAFTVENKQEFHLPKHDEDFATLEQHIEDLTQEKFSLQRALEASRALAESLASENLSLTDSYNTQRTAINQLKADMEKVQEEISEQVAELESMRREYANALLECNAADERAKLLASEVIGLEEKALRLRSSELKLERQLETSLAESTALKKKMSSLEKERLDLQSTIDALQEEKKVLQSKLRKSSEGKPIEVGQNAIKKDMSTSTADLVDTTASTLSQQAEHSGSVDEHDASSSLLLSDTLQFNLESSFVYIPPDQLRMIENINTIISELALEKEEIAKALTHEKTNNSRLKDLNTELSRKLEAQTQRLELLTAQSMASVSMPAKLPDPRSVPNNTAYADEGDEVVERVLGWIMKLFPGGPSRQRSNKLL